MTSVDQPQTMKGFTLIEMLSVLAVLVLLIAAMGPAIRGISDSQGVDSGVHDVANFLEMARNQAVTRQTYVWVGVTSGTSLGSSVLQMGGAFSVDGSGTNTASTNMKPFTKVLTVRNVALTPWSALKQATITSATNVLNNTTTPKDVFGSTTGVPGTFNVGASQFTKTTITFTPQGQAMLSGIVTGTNGYDGLIDISLRQAHGTPPIAGATTVDDAAVIIDGALGTTSIVQLK